MTFSRRGLLRLGMLAGAANVLRVSAPAAPASSGPLFSEVPASASGIAWVHENAMSPSRFLPEALGPGCAFLDYDNDGWMDIFLVNSGPSDFWKPPKPVRNALYKNNRDGTFTDVTEKAGVAGSLFRHGRRRRGLRQRRLAGHLGDRLRELHPVQEQSRWNLQRRDRACRRRHARLYHQRRLVRLRQRRQARSLHLQFCGILRACASWSAAITRSAEIITASRGYSSPSTSFLYHNNGDGTFTDVTKGTAIASALGKGLGVVATDINNDGRMDLFVANDTVQNFLFVNRGPGANGQWKWDEIALAGGGWFQRQRTASFGHGRGCSRPRTETDGRICLSPT